MSSTPLIIRIVGDNREFNAALAASGAAVSGFQGRLATTSQSLQSFGNAMTVGITLPFVTASAKILQITGEVDSLRRALETTAGSAEEGAKQFGRLQQIAKLPGIGLEEAVRGSIRLQNYGLSVGYAEKALRAFSNAVASAGGSTEDTQEALRQLGQIFGRQKVTMDNLRIVLERVPQAAKIIREKFGSEALADPAKAFERLGISSKQFVETLIDETLKLSPVSAGIKTSLENLRQEITLSASRIGDHFVPAIQAVIPKIEALARGIAGAFDLFFKLPSEITNTVIAVTAFTVAAGPMIAVATRMAAAFANLRNVIAGLGIAEAIGSIGGVAEASANTASAAAGLRSAREALASASIGKGLSEAFIGVAQAKEALATATATEAAAIASARAMAIAGGAATAAGVAVYGFGRMLTQSSTALENQRKAASDAADSLNRLDESFRNFGKPPQPKKTFEDFDKELQRIRHSARETQDAIDGIKLTPFQRAMEFFAPERFQGASVVRSSISDIMDRAGIKKTFETYQKEIEALRGAEKQLLEMQGWGVNVSGNLAIVRKELADTTKSLAAAMGEVVKAEAERITVDRVAFDDAGNISKTSLVYVEQLERQKNALGKVKDLLYEYADAGNYGKKFITDFYRDTKFANEAADDFRLALAKARFELVALSNMPPIKMVDIISDGFRRGSVNEAGDILGNIGAGKSSLQRSAEIQKAEAALNRLKQLNQEGKATGNDVIEAQIKLKQLQDGDSPKTPKRAKSELLQQISTVFTDLSRSVSRSITGLIFDRPKVDLGPFQREIAELTAEQDKLNASARRGQNVSAQLAIVQGKLADANRRMGEEARKASLGFRALQAAKSIVQDLAQSIIRILIEGALKQLAKKLASVGGLIGKIFGGLGGGSKTPKVPSMDTPSTPGGGVSSALGGVAGAINVVSGVVSAVSSVVGNFQMAHMNTALGRIEESTRYLKIWTGEQSQNLLWCAQKSTEYLGYAVTALDSIGKMQSQALALAQQGGAGGAVYNFNFSGATFGAGMNQATADQMIRLSVEKLMRQGLR